MVRVGQPLLQESGEDPACSAGGAFLVGGRKVSQVLPDSGLYSTVLPGMGGTLIKTLQLGHCSSRPENCSSICSRRLQCGQGNLNSLMVLRACLKKEKRIKPLI